jgi:hypothetical protein
MQKSEDDFTKTREQRSQLDAPDRFQTIFDPRPLLEVQPVSTWPLHPTGLADHGRQRRMKWVLGPIRRL